MPWNSTAPLGSSSVKANKPILGQNTTYIEDTMGKVVVGTNTVTTRDHFWNVSSNLDGRHRFIQSPAFTSTVVTVPPNTPVIGSGMDGVMYLRTTFDGSVQGFYRNGRNINQFIPALHTGDHSVTSSFTNISLSPAIPNNSFGEIFMYRDSPGKTHGARGFFRATSNEVEAWAYYQQTADDTVPATPIIFGNGSNASGLNIRVKVSGSATPATYHYIITYRDI